MLSGLDIQNIKKLLEESTKEELICGAIRKDSHEETLAYIGDVLKASETTECWATWYQAPQLNDPSKEGSVFTAITGNGPTSKANAIFYSMARKIVIDLLQERESLLAAPKEERAGRRLCWNDMDLMIGILRGYSINALAHESDIEPKVLEKALHGEELSESDAEALEEMIHEYSQE